MHVLYLNYSYDNRLQTVDDVLKQYHVIPEWCSAVRNAGATRVTVAQRFSQIHSSTYCNVDYHFVKDTLPPRLAWWHNPSSIHNLVSSLSPDVVHLNGAPYFARSLRPMLKTTTPLLWQFRTSGFPRWRSRWFWKKSLQQTDGAIFTSLAQTRRWHEHGLLAAGTVVYEVLPASSTFTPVSYHESRSRLRMNGQTVFLWVGRLNANKDPLTVLQGFHDFVKTTTSAHLYMIYHETDLLSQVEHTIKQLSLSNCVHLVGYVPHEQLPEYYSASDFFVIGSHEEVCGYALIEAIACGSTPIVTDIPSFRKITGDGSIGFLWEPRNPNSLATALMTAQQERQERKAVRSFFETHLSYEQLGKQALKIYADALVSRSLLNREN